MNKLTEIKDCLKVLDNPDEYTKATYCMAEDELQSCGSEWLKNLIYIIENKNGLSDSGKLLTIKNQLHWIKEGRKKCDNQILNVDSIVGSMDQLISLLEEKDKALTIAKTTLQNIRKDADEYTFRTAIGAIHFSDWIFHLADEGMKSINTSSNNEGDV